MKRFIKFPAILILVLINLSISLRAQVICTDVNPDIVNSGNASLDIDLNNDLTADFRITSASVSILSFVVVQGSQIGTGNFVLSNGSGGALALPLNAPIGATSTTWTQMNSTNQIMIQVASGSGTGTWAGATDQYLGLALAVGSSTFYGWARFSFSSTTNQYTFKDYAYQSSAGVQILAGESCGSITNPIFNLPDSLCAGSTVTVTAGTGTDIPTSYSWAVPPGVTNSSNSASSTALTFTAPGTSTVILMVTNSSTFGFAIRTLYIKPPPTLSIIPAGNTTICPGASATLTALSNASTFSWTSNPPGNISTPTSHSIVVTPTTTSNYIVLATLNGCTVVAQRVLIINPAPTMSFSSTWSLCAQNLNNSKDYVTLSAPGHTLSGNSTWPLVVTTNSTGGAAVLTAAPPYMTTNTLVPVTLTVSDGSCSALLLVSFSIIANPVITLSPFPATLCAGQQHTITLSGAESFSWVTNPPGMMPNQTPTLAVIAPTSSATFSVFAAGAPSQCRSATHVNSVSVVPGPSLTVTSLTACIGNTVTLTASGAAGYSWAAPSGPVSSSSTAAVNAGNSEGTVVYTVTGTGNNACTSKSQATLTILACTGLKGETIPSISLYPQPASLRVTLVTGVEAESEITMLDLTGRVVLREKCVFNSLGAAEIDVSGLPDGLYTITVRQITGIRSGRCFIRQE